MAAFNLSLTIGGNTFSLSGTASAGDLTRFSTAAKAKYGVATDAEAAAAFLADCQRFAKALTRNEERKAAETASVDSIGEITIT